MLDIWGMMGEIYYYCNICAWGIFTVAYVFLQYTDWNYFYEVIKSAHTVETKEKPATSLRPPDVILPFTHIV